MTRRITQSTNDPNGSGSWDWMFSSTQQMRLYKISLIVGVIGLVVSFPLALNLPLEVAFENGPIENFQVILLIGEAIYSLYLSMNSRSDDMKSFHVFCSMLFVMMTVRELSWGRVFYQVDIDKHGPVFVDMADYAWRPEAYAFMIIFGLMMLFMLVKRVPLRKMWNCRLPREILMIVVIGTILQYCGEHGFVIGKFAGQTLEEINETIIYAMFPAICSYYHYNLD